MMPRSLFFALLFCLGTAAAAPVTCPEGQGNLPDATLIWPDQPGSDTRNCGNAASYVADYCGRGTECNEHLFSMCCGAGVICGHGGPNLECQYCTSGSSNSTASRDACDSEECLWDAERGACGNRHPIDDGGLRGVLSVFPLILGIAVVTAVCCCRKRCSGWGALEDKYHDPSAGSGATFLGQPRIFRARSPSSCIPVKFDKIMHVSASPTHLHLRPTCCENGMRPLAVPWTHVADNGVTSIPCLGMNGRLVIDNEFRCMMSLHVYHQCKRYMGGGTAAGAAGAAGGGGVQMQPVTGGQVQTIAPVHVANSLAMNVVVPAGAFGGQLVTVAAPSGAHVQVTIPHGLVPGQSFQCTLPPQAPVVVTGQVVVPM